MRIAIILMGLLTVFSACGTGEKPTVDTGKVALFDGKTLKGWEGNREFFRVEDGAIVAGRLDKPIPRNEFLCTEKEYGDFELHLKFKVSDWETVNAGVQLRSRRVPGSHEVSGYQADIAQIFWGNLYDESRRNIILAGFNGIEMFALSNRSELENYVSRIDTTKLFSFVKRDGWNDYRIRCEGDRVQLWINGVQTVDYREADASIPRSGIIGLQIHSGPPGEAWYKNIYIEEIGG